MLPNLPKILASENWVSGVWSLWDTYVVVKHISQSHCDDSCVCARSRFFPDSGRRQCNESPPLVSRAPLPTQRRRVRTRAGVASSERACRRRRDTQPRWLRRRAALFTRRRRPAIERLAAARAHTQLRAEGARDSGRALADQLAPSPTCSHRAC